MTYIISAILLFLFYHFFNIQLGKWNVAIVKNRIATGNKKQIEHFWWFTGYLILCAPMYWILNIWFALSLLPLHLSIFAVAYNHFMGFLPFNLSHTSNAITDKTLIKIGFNDLEWPCIISEVLAVALFIISLFHL
jgi:hypothetical protein